MEVLRQTRSPSELFRRKVDGPTEPPSGEVRLGNCHYSVLLTSVGSGKSEWDGLAVSRWAPHLTCPVDGVLLYLRDLESGAVWSAGYLPTRTPPDAYDFRSSPSVAEISRLDGRIECRLSVCVAPDHDFEMRRCRLTNHGDRPRRIELTSYVEFVLAPYEADANHPTFSKLFVETQYLSEMRAVFARRRPRGASEPERWGFHRLLIDSEARPTTVQFETDRKAFIGRGRDLARPRAMDPGTELTGREGPVLDPIGSLRTSVALQPGETRDVVYLLGSAASREELVHLALNVDDLSAAMRMFTAVEENSPAFDERVRLRIDAAAHDALTTPQYVWPTPPIYRPASQHSAGIHAADPNEDEPLQFENSYGGFSADGREYVIRIQSDGKGQLRLPPQPWVNVIANEHAGCLVTERGAGYTWAGNSRHNRLTTWHNDPICDPHSEALWIRDEDAKVFWSPTPGPSPSPAPYEVRHGFGYTKFRLLSRGLAQEVTFFMAPDEPLKLVRVRVENRSDSPRRLSVLSYLQWSLRSTPVDSDPITVGYDPQLDAILAVNPKRQVYGKHVAFSAVVAEGAGPLSHTSDRESFLGRFGDLHAPAAIMGQTRLDHRAGGRGDPCAAWQVPLIVSPRATVECTFLLGETADRDEAAKLLRKYRQPGQAQEALDQVIAFWNTTLSAVRIETPDPELDLLVNGWLPYQNLACRMWGRSAYYQPGGAYGFRDQLQDSAALVYHRPDITRQQILRHAGQQFADGDVMHWWHPDLGIGLRTRFSDDLAWLPYVTAAYVRTTGDEALWDETARFVCGEVLSDGEQDKCLSGLPSNEPATVYEHCCRALDRALTTGPHGLPLIGSGDWNDGMNRVGKAGRGESVWLGFFLYAILDLMIPLCERRSDLDRAAAFAAERRRLAGALESAGWDGNWYRRAYYDNGQPLGSIDCDECQIDAIAQAWAVLSGAAPAERSNAAVLAAVDRLFDRSAGLIRLLTPPFNKTHNDPGYIKGYVPGVRENGGQYTHGVLWLIRALAELGCGGRAVELLKMLSPISHTATEESVDVYQTEPYVVAADVYSAPPHVGRGGWTWYTGSAGWMFRVAVESILGLSIENGTTLVLRPAISPAWPQCRLQYRLPNEKTRYDVVIENPHGKETGVTSARLDGREMPVVENAARVPIEHDGREHHVLLRL